MQIDDKNKFNFLKARQQTPGVNHVLHFNNAGAALMPMAVINSVNEHFQLEITCGGYEAAAMATTSTEKFYSSASRLIGCKPQEIAYLESATRAFDMFFYSLDFSKGDRILTSQAEYASNFIAFMHLSKKKNISIEVVGNDEWGQVSLEKLKNLIDKKVKLIAITHVPTQGGLVNPAREIGKIAQEAKICYLLDATQSIGQMPINVQEIGCDALCATGRKYLRGPRGTGFLYVSENIISKLNPPFLDLHAAKWLDKNQFQVRPDARQFETWEANYANRIGLGSAIDYALSWGLENIWNRVTLLANDLRQKLSSISGLTIHDQGLQKCGIVTFTLSSLSAEEIQAILLQKKINVSVSLMEYARLDMEKRGLNSLLRASVHYYNTVEENDRFCEEIQRIGK